MNKIRKFMNTGLIKVITGVRRCGKSMMMELIQQELLASGIKSENCISINFEDLRNAEFCSVSALHGYVSKRVSTVSGKVYLFLDEIQNVPEWEKCVNSFRVEFDIDIYVTGSNANLLSGEFATLLAGRYVSITMYPLSFTEFCDLYTTGTDSTLNDAELFRKYIHFGGMPFLGNLKYDEQSSRQYLTDLYNSVVLKDVVQRNSIRNVDVLERILLYIFANTGRTFSATSISKYFKSENRSITAETILNYITMCEQACLVYRVNRQDLRGKELLTVNEKYYVCDHGLRQAVYGKNEPDIEIILENIVYLELLRRGFTVTVGRQGMQEIDFVAEKSGSVMYFQICYMLAGEETQKREFTPLMQIKDNFPKFVLSLDSFDMSRDGICNKNIITWLKQNDELFPAAVR